MGFGVWGLGFEVQGLVGVQGLGCRVEGLRCRVEGLGCRVEGSGCRVRVRSAGSTA